MENIRKNKKISANNKSTLIRRERERKAMNMIVSVFIAILLLVIITIGKGLYLWTSYMDNNIQIQVESAKMNGVYQPGHH